MTEKSVAGLFLLFVAVVLTVRTVFGTVRGPNRAVRMLAIAGMAIFCSMVIYDGIIGLDFGRYPDEAAAFLAGIGMWGVAWIWAAERRAEVRSQLRISRLKVDALAVDENPNWVREQVLEQPVPPDWERLLPLVDAGWNGGFAWLTPEFVREQMARPLPAKPDPEERPRLE